MHIKLLTISLGQRNGDLTISGVINIELNEFELSLLAALQLHEEVVGIVFDLAGCQISKFLNEFFPGGINSTLYVSTIRPILSPGVIQPHHLLLIEIFIDLFLNRAMLTTQKIWL